MLNAGETAINKADNVLVLKEIIHSCVCLFLASNRHMWPA